jgi:hypothetical protein
MLNPNLITIILRDSLLAANNSPSFQPFSFEPFIQAVKSRGIKPNIPFLEHMLDRYGDSSEVNFDRLSILFSHFPASPIKSVFPEVTMLARRDCLLRIAARSQKATSSERLKLILLLLDGGENPNWLCKDYKPYHAPGCGMAVGEIWNRKEKETALHAVVERGDVEIVKLFLERGAKKDLVDGRGRTAESKAEMAGKMEAVKLLQGWSGPSRRFFRLLGL